MPARQSGQALSQWYLRSYFQFVYLLTIFPNSVHGPNAVGEERWRKTSTESPTISTTPSTSATACVPSNHLLCREDRTLSSLPLIPLHPRHCAPLRLRPNRKLTRHSTYYPSECYYGQRHFVDTADEDPLIEALKRQVQASEDGRKMGRSAPRLGNSRWDKIVGWRGRE